MSNEDMRFEEERKNSVIEDVPFNGDTDTVKEMSVIEKVFGVFFSPTQTFKALREKSEAWIPMVLVPLVMVLYYVIFWSSVETMLITQMEAQYAQMGIEVMPGMIETAIGIQRIIMPVSVLVMYFVMLAISALYYFVAGKIAKADLSYGKAFVLSAYVSLIGLVSWIIIIVMTIITGEYDTTMPLTSLASLLPESLQGTLAYFAALPIEVISIWSLAVTYIALKSMGSFSKKAAGWSVAIMFLFGVLISIGGGLMMSLVPGA